MLEVRIFKFDAKSDVLAYHKPYFFDKFEFETLENLLIAAKEQDPYFGFEKVKYVKLNSVVAPLSWDFGDILEHFSPPFIIEPLSTRRAVKDLAINNDDFLEKFILFNKLYDKSDFEAYKHLEPYFYAGFMSEFEPNFIGASGIIFAQKMCEKYPQKTEQILSILDDTKFGVWAAQSIKHDIFWSDGVYEEALNFVKSRLKAPSQILPPLKEFDAEPFGEIKRDFAGFNAAAYGNFTLPKEGLRAKILRLESQNLPCGFELLGLNDELAYKLAATILFEAFDSGADFLIAGSEREFYMFDGLYKKLEKSAGRSLQDFYILRFGEFATLTNGKIPTTLKEHRLKVRLL